VDSFFVMDDFSPMTNLSEFADLSEISDGGPPTIKNNLIFEY